MRIILTFKWDSHAPVRLQVLSVYDVEWCIERKSEMNFSVLLHADGCSLHNSSSLLTSILMKLMWLLIVTLGSLRNHMMWKLNKRKEVFVSFLFSSYFCLFLEKYGRCASVPLKSQLLIPPAAAACKQSRQNMSWGTGRENESSKYTQWPLQTPSMINAKGLLFLICQSFQRSLTYAYFQPCRSHHSSRWSGTSKPITARFCCGPCCQSCKLAHLQPIIMHCSKEQHVFLWEGWRWTT